MIYWRQSMAMKAEKAGQSGARFFSGLRMSLCTCGLQRMSGRLGSAAKGGIGPEKKSHFSHFMELTIPAELVILALTMQI
jgi:hypothetical protein